MFYLSTLSLTNAMRSRGMGIPSSPGPILETSLGTRYSHRGPNCVVRILDLADGELQDVSIGSLLTLLVLPFRVLYLVFILVQLTHHNCIYCPQINFQRKAAIHPTNFMFPLQQEAISPVTRSCLLPPPRRSHSQAIVAWPRPPLRPSYSLPAGTTTIATTQATLTPPGSTTGIATGQVIGHHHTSTSTDPATAHATLTPPG